VQRLIGSEVETQAHAADKEEGFVGVRVAEEGGEPERVFPHTDSWVCRDLVEMGLLLKASMEEGSRGRRRGGGDDDFTAGARTS
jgi:hypothetical protein